MNEKNNQQLMKKASEYFDTIDTEGGEILHLRIAHGLKKEKGTEGAILCKKEIVLVLGDMYEPDKLLSLTINDALLLIQKLSECLMSDYWEIANRYELKAKQDEEAKARKQYLKC